jgi:hypothetical protein
VTDQPDKIELAGVDISNMIYSWSLGATAGQSRMVTLQLQVFDTFKVNGRTVAEILDPPPATP